MQYQFDEDKDEMVRIYTEREVIARAVIAAIVGAVLATIFILSLN